MNNMNETGEKKERKVVIDRSKWGCGHAPQHGDRFLLNRLGFKCCLGFAVQQLEGRGDHELLDRAAPANLGMFMEILTARASTGIIYDSSFSIKAMEINDCSFIDNEDRELRLQALGEKHGITFEFVGEYPKAT